MGPRYQFGSGKLNALLVDPTNGAVMYVGGGVGANDNVQTSAGVFKSTNGGKSWSAANNGLQDATVNAMWMDPLNPSTLIAATEYGGIFKSSDGAASWSQVSSASPILSLASFGGKLYAAGPGGVLVSTNSGSTWNLAFPTVLPAESVAVAGTTVYIGDIAGNVYVSQGGSTPTKAFTFTPSGGVNPDVHGLVADPLTPSTAFAAVNGYSNAIFSANLYVTTNNGLTWSLIPIPPGARGAQSIAMSTTVPHQLYILGTNCLATKDAGASLNPCGGGGYGDGRFITAAPSLPPSDIPTGASGSEPLLGVGDQGAYIGANSSSAGTTQLTAGLSNSIVRSLVVSGSAMVATAQDWAAGWTSDGGATWISDSTGPQENGYLFQNPVQPAHCYLFADYIRISTDGCHSFDDTDHGYGGFEGATTGMAFDPATIPKAYLATTTGVYVTSDGVRFAPTGWPITSPMNVAIDPKDPNTIFVSANDAPGFGSIHYTHDGGKTWNISAGISPHGTSYPGDAPVIAVSPAHSYIVFAATGTEIFRSVNSGASFSSMGTYPASVIRVNAEKRQMEGLRTGRGDDDNISTGSQRSTRHSMSQMQPASVQPGFNPGQVLVFSDGAAPTAVPPLVYIRPAREMLVSTDYGAHWHDISANAVSRWFSGIVFQRGTMYVATNGQGIIHSNAPLVGASAAERHAYKIQISSGTR